MTRGDVRVATEQCGRVQYYTSLGSNPHHATEMLYDTGKGFSHYWSFVFLGYKNNYFVGLL